MNRDARAVFLDINGVLNPFGSNNPGILDAAGVDRVRRLAKEARIVLASSWPRDRAEEALGIPLEELDYHERRLHDGRPRAILAWLRAHAEVTHWVSIDDDHIVRDLERAIAREPALIEKHGPPSHPLPRELLAHRERFLRTDWTSRFRQPDHGKGGGLTETVYRRALRLLRGEVEETRDVQIARVKAAMVRREGEMQALVRAAVGACCPACLYGRRYTDLTARQERAGAWLSHLLRKRGTPEDLRLAEAIRSAAWP